MEWLASTLPAVAVMDTALTNNLPDGILTKRARFKSVHVHFPVFCIVFWRSKIHWG